MPAKRPAAKSAKGKKAASRTAVRKALPRKPDAARARVVAAHGRKSAAAAPPRKVPGAHSEEAPSEPATEMKKPPRPPGAVTAPPAPTPQPAIARAAAP